MTFNPPFFGLFFSRRVIMTNFWLFPFAMIGYWFVGAVIELIRTPIPISPAATSA